MFASRLEGRGRVFVKHGCRPMSMSMETSPFFSCLHSGDGTR